MAIDQWVIMLGMTLLIAFVGMPCVVAMGALYWHHPGSPTKWFIVHIPESQLARVPLIERKGRVVLFSFE